MSSLVPDHYSILSDNRKRLTIVKIRQCPYGFDRLLEGIGTRGRCCGSLDTHLRMHRAPATTSISKPEIQSLLQSMCPLTQRPCEPHPGHGFGVHDVHDVRGLLATRGPNYTNVHLQITNFMELQHFGNLRVNALAFHLFDCLSECGSLAQHTRCLLL